MSTEDRQPREKWQLLQNLRCTVEALLTHGVSNVWSVYGGLNRLHAVMEKIFKHGSRIFDANGEPDCWTLIQGLNWLQPSLVSSPSTSDSEEYNLNLPKRIALHKDMLWLYKSLEDHSLSQKLSWLLSDKEHLLSCLEPWAFLCQRNLAEATLVCLKAVEKNQPTLLTDIDPSLFLSSWSNKDSPKHNHRRSSSYPVNFCSSKYQSNSTAIPADDLNISNDISSPAIVSSVDTTIKDEPTFLKAWSSFPKLNEAAKFGTNLIEMKKPDAREKTIDVGQSIELSCVIKVDYSETKPDAVSTEHNLKPTKSKYISKKSSKQCTPQNKKLRKNLSSSAALARTDPDKILVASNYSITDSLRIVESKPEKSTLLYTCSAPEFATFWNSEVEGQKDIRTPKKSFIEDGGSSVLPMATGYFPKPEEGQSLTSFLTSAQFARTNAVLDRENAHFSISEAMIAAIEQLKCNRHFKLLDETADESDEEINTLKQRIRLRRRQRQEERRLGHLSPGWSRELLSDGKTDTTTTDQSVSPISTSPGTRSDSLSTDDDDIEDCELDETQDLLSFKNSGLSVSMASLYSEADIYKSSQRYGSESTLLDSTISAEGVALSLISRFSEKHLPRASELKWLVTEQDAPQRLLPLPNSWPISPDDAEHINSNNVHLRGTCDWAPPRPQIIFTAHPPPVRRILIAKQNYRCAGCGMKVAVEYANKFRYCEYLGRFFCTGCHTNQVNFIPGKILSKWDFNKHPVSSFSYRLLEQMMDDPLFQVQDLNPSLYRRIKQLDRTRLLRSQLFYLKDFLLTCRFASKTQEAVNHVPSHLISDPHIYSISDFTAVKTGALPQELNTLFQECCKHVSTCELCQARGFVCEICNAKEVIYPWELSRVTRCDKCGTCYHLNCIGTAISESTCKRCNRLRERKKTKEQNDIISS